MKQLVFLLATTALVTVVAMEHGAPSLVTYIIGLVAGALLVFTWAAGGDDAGRQG